MILFHIRDGETTETVCIECEPGVVTIHHNIEDDDTPSPPDAICMSTEAWSRLCRIVRGEELPVVVGQLAFWDVRGEVRQ